MPSAAKSNFFKNQIRDRIKRRSPLSSIRLARTPYVTPVRAFPVFSQDFLFLSFFLSSFALSIPVVFLQPRCID